MKTFVCMPLYALLAGASLLSCGEKEQTKSHVTTPINVSVQPVVLSDANEQLHYSGTIEADNSVQFGFSVPGTVQSVVVNEGQAVKAGQLLATLDGTEYENALLIANAGLEQAEDMYKRLEELYKKGSLPAKDFIDIKTRLVQAKANSNLSAKRVKDTRLYAPVSGIITSKSIEKGATAAPGVPAFTMIKISQVYAKVTIPESEIGRISRGQTASVTIPTLNQEVNGKIAIINPQADPVSRSFSVKIQLPNNTGKLLPGMIAEARIATGNPTSQLTIPATAVVRDADELTYVFITNAQNKATRRRITTGRITGDNSIIVTDGLQPGDRLITAGQSKLKDGSLVSVN